MPGVVCPASHVRLEWAPDGKVQVAHHLLLGESRELPVSDEPWTMHIGSSGNAFVSCSGMQPLWCSLLFTGKVHAAAADGKLFVRWADERLEWVDAMVNDRVVFDIEIAPRRGNSGKTKSLAFRVARAGCHVFIGLSSLYRTLGFTMYRGLPGVWLKNLMRTLHRFAHSMGYGEDDMLKATPVCRGDDEESGDDGEGVENFFCASSRFVVMLLCKWQARSPKLGGLKNEQDSIAAQRGLIALLTISDLWVLSCDFPGGEGERHMRVQGGKLDLSMDDAMCKRLQEFAPKECFENTAAVDLSTLLVAGMKSDRSASSWPVCLHLFQRVGESIDWILSQQFLSARGDDDTDLRRVWNRGDASQILPTTLTKYIFASRSKFLGTTMHLSTAPDCSRIGKRSLFQTVFVGADNVGMVAPPQVMRDYMSDTTVALEGGSRQQRQEAGEAWKVRARAWLKRQREEETHSAKQPARKKHRTKAYHWLVCLDSSLQKATSTAGLAHFLVEASEERRPCPWTWPQLTIVPDRGSDGMAAVQFLLYNDSVRGNIVHVPDPNHDCWNDVRTVAKSIGLGGFLVAKTICLNYRHGPWQDARFYTAGQQAVDEYMSICSPHTCPVFQVYFMRLAAEYDMEDFRAQEDFEELVWSRFREVKGSKCAMSRWFDLVDVAAKDEPFTKLVGLIYYGIQTGDLQASSFASLMSGKLKSSDLHSDEDKVPVGKSNEACQKLREACKNSSVFATVCYSDPMDHFKTNLLVVGTAATRKWHSAQSVTLRSCGGSLQFYTDLSKNGLLPSICETLAILSDEGALARLGFESEVVASGRPCDDDHPKLAEEDVKAKLLGKFLLGLAKQRIMKTMWSTHGWPGRFVLIASAGDRDRVINDLRGDYENFVKASESKRPYLKRLTKRSIFQTVAVQQVVGMLRSQEWQSSGRLEAHCRSQWSIVGASKITEDIFQRYRWFETKSCHQHPAVPSIWAESIRTRVLDEVHRYEPLAYEREVVPRASSGLLPASLYVPSPTKASLNLKGIIGPATPPWHTSNSINYAMPICDMLLLRFCQAHDCMNNIGNAWLSLLFRCGQQLVKRPSERQWYFALGEVAGSMGLGWPAVEVEGCFMPKLPLELNEVELLICLALDDWQSMTYMWQSPARVDPRRRSSMRVLAKASGNPQSLLKTAAENCFYDLPMAPLRHIAKFIGCEYPPAAKMYEMVKLLVKFVMPEVLDNRLVQILMMRLHEDDMQDAFLQPDDIEPLLDKSDKQEFNTFWEKRTNREAEMKDYKSDLNTFKAAVRATAKGRAAGKARSEVKKKHIPYNIPPDSHIDSEFANSQAPPGSRVYQDCYNNRWLITQAGHGHRSRSWGIYGSRGALLRVLAWAWENYTSDSGIACPVHEVREYIGIESSAGEAAVASSASSASH